MDEPTPTRKRRLKWVALAALVFVAAGAAAWWVYGNHVWSDGRSGPDAIRVPSDAEAPRQVLWAPPHGLPSPFNTADHEYEPSLSSDGTELYFVRGKAGLPTTRPTDPAGIGATAHIFVSYRRFSAWTTPVPLDAVNSPYDDLGPRLTADGRFLLFYSNRPGGLGGYDIWAAPRSEDGKWGAAFNLGPGVNSEFDEYNPAPSPDGRRLFFSTNRTAAQREQREAWRATIRAAPSGDFDLWMADVESWTYLATGAQVSPTSQPATAPAKAAAAANFKCSNARVVPGVNTPFHEGASCLSPGGDFLYFASNRPNGFGRFDLYRSRVMGDSFGPPENLGPTVNTADNETDPQLAAGGFHLYFSSDRAPAEPHPARTPAAAAAGKIHDGGSLDGGSVESSNADTRPAAVAVDSPPGYDLYESDSREVFSQRLSRSAPAMGRNTWLMLLSLLVLLPLLYFMRHFDRRALSLLQKCLLIALMIHVCMLFSFTLITAVVPGFAGGLGKDLLGKLGFSEVAVQLDGPPGNPASDIAMAVRQQSMTDLPLTPAAPSGQMVQQTVGEELRATPDVAVNVPQATAGREPLTVLVTPPRIDPPRQPTAAVVVPVQVAQIAPQLAPIDVKLDAGPRLQTAEPAPLMQPTQAPVASMEAAPAQPVRPLAVAAPDLPITRSQVSLGSVANDFDNVKSGISAMENAKVQLPEPIRVAGVTPSLSAGELLTKPETASPNLPTVPIAGGEPTSSAAALVTTPGLSRQDASAGVLAGASAMAVDVRPDVARNAPGSLVPSGPATRPSTAIPARVAVVVTPPSPAALTSAVVPATLLSATAAPKPAFGQIASNSPDVRPAEAAPTGVRQEGIVAASGAKTSSTVDLNPDIARGKDRSLASATIIPPRAVPAAVVQPRSKVSGLDIGPVVADAGGLKLDAPKIGPSPAAGEGHITPMGSVAMPVGSLEREPTAARSSGAADAIGGRPVHVVSAEIPGADVIGPGRALFPPPVVGPHASIAVGPMVSVSPHVSIDPPRIGMPEALFQRAAEQRGPLIEKLGGTQESENAVERGLAWLSKVQESDGRWTWVGDGGKRAARKATAVREHDMALTGLSSLAFLASDHSPAKEGPYRQTVTRGLDWLVAEQGADGDLRGSREMRGEGSSHANMYDQGIATMALAEAALMTKDRRYTEAAFKAAKFICDTQNKKTGGWRYVPGEAGDTSVFGWQILALHNCEQLGFRIPPDVREGAVHFLSLVSSGRSNMLAGYLPGTAPTPTMTAEALFCRILLGQPIDDAAGREVSQFLTRDLPQPEQVELYYWYYASLSLAQMQANPQVRQTWERWNKRCRDALIATQVRQGGQAGSWSDPHWGERTGAGKVFSTALATLTLEVYYRYLPIQPADVNDDKAAGKAVISEKASVRPEAR